MMTQTARAKARFASYAALAVVLLLLAALFPEFRPGLFTLLALLGGWWLRLDPVGPDGGELRVRWLAALRAWLRRKPG